MIDLDGILPFPYQYASEAETETFSSDGEETCVKQTIAADVHRPPPDADAEETEVKEVEDDTDNQIQGGYSKCLHFA